MKTNYFIDPTLTSEHLDFYLKQMSPLVQEVETVINAPATPLWGYHDDRMIPLELTELCEISTQGKKVAATTITGESISLKQRLYQIAEQLPANFSQVSQSQLVNRDQIDHLAVGPSHSINIILKNKVVAPVSRRYVKALQERMGF